MPHSSRTAAATALIGPTRQTTRSRPRHAALDPPVSTSAAARLIGMVRKRSTTSRCASRADWNMPVMTPSPAAVAVGRFLPWPAEVSGPVEMEAVFDRAPSRVLDSIGSG
ncbi:hypothetical protein [Streptomyces sp. IB2014 016-6]|uniref:hypothetical protein n=1 Tax=Streptomyces sp. IB2014 016-6 TaxID=2517818 RepID=UPI001F503993|nr:hypothetical protein [Streptomyces sp. IB2014 016-6]